MATKKLKMSELKKIIKEELQKVIEQDEVQTEGFFSDKIKGLANKGKGLANKGMEKLNARSAEKDRMEAAKLSKEFLAAVKKNAQDLAGLGAQEPIQKIIDSLNNLAMRPGDRPPLVTNLPFLKEEIGVRQAVAGVKKAVSTTRDDIYDFLKRSPLAKKLLEITNFSRRLKDDSEDPRIKQIAAILHDTCNDLQKMFSFDKHSVHNLKRKGLE